MNLKTQAGVKSREYKGQFCFSYFKAGLVHEGIVTEEWTELTEVSSYPSILKIPTDIILGF